MSKQLSLKQAKRILRNAGCTPIREFEHAIWRRADGSIFSLPNCKKYISMGVTKKLYLFVEGF